MSDAEERWFNAGCIMIIAICAVIVVIELSVILRLPQ